MSFTQERQYMCGLDSLQHIITHQGNQHLTQAIARKRRQLMVFVSGAILLVAIMLVFAYFALPALQVKTSRLLVAVCLVMAATPLIVGTISAVREFRKFQANPLELARQTGVAGVFLAKNVMPQLLQSPWLDASEWRGDTRVADLRAALVQLAQCRLLAIVANPPLVHDIANEYITLFQSAQQAVQKLEEYLQSIALVKQYLSGNALLADDISRFEGALHQEPDQLERQLKGVAEIAESTRGTVAKFNKQLQNYPLNRDQQLSLQDLQKANLRILLEQLPNSFWV